MKLKRFLALSLTLAMVLSAMGPLLPASASDSTPAQVSSGFAHTLVVMSDGTLWAAGANTAGQLGDGTLISSGRPIKVMEGVASAVAGEKHSFAIKTDGSLWAWGSSEFGVLGVGPIAKSVYASPTKVMDGVKQVATGTSHTVILKTDGTVYVTGRNQWNVGQLGRATNESVTSPQLLMSDVKQISADSDYALAVKNDGSLYGWGSNELGRLGIAQFDSDNRTSPTKIADGVAQADCGGSFSFYVTTGGELYGSGSSYLGNGRASDRDARVKIMDGVKSVSAGRNHVAVIKTDGSLYVWGENGDGQLGLGHANTVTSPALLKQSGVTQVSAGSRHTMAIMDGGLYGCGFNGKGRLMDGSANDAKAPVRAMTTALQQPATQSVDVAAKPGTAAGSWSQSYINLIASIAPSGLLKDYAQAISRYELASLTVAMRQALTGQKLTDTETHIHPKFFHDMTFSGSNSVPNMDMIYAYEYGMVDARSFRYFEPQKAATRDEVYAAVVRLAQSAGLKLNTTSPAAVAGVEAADSRYQQDIKVAYHNGLKSGESDTSLRPKEVATRELALYLCGLLYEKRTNLKPAGLGTPVLQWSYGGTNQDWSYEWHYASPAVVKNAASGRYEIISSSYHITSMDAVTGKVNWRVTTGTDRNTALPASFTSESRTWDDVVIADLDGDGKQWIVAAHDNGKLSVLDMNGYFRPGWAGKVVAGGRHIRSLAVGDINKDGKLEIVVGATGDDSLNTWVYNAAGNVMPGWPKLEQSGPYVYAFGIYSDNITLGDLDGDGDLEIIVPSDTKSVAVYHHDGSFYMTGSAHGGVPWHEVQVWADYGYEKTPGYKTATDPSTPQSQRMSAQMGHAGAVVKDVDGDGKKEIVLTTIIFDAVVGYPPSHYVTAMIYNADHTRYQTSLGDWTVPPTTGAPASGLSEVNTALQRVRYNPVVEDLDGDGRCEILFASYDGKLHCFSLDKTEKNSWPYTVYAAGQGSLKYACEPTVLDINGDGYKEVILTTWCDKEGGENGKLMILSHKGELLTETTLPFSIGSLSNGSMASPVLQDVNGDGVYEAIVSTTMSGICVYTLPGTTTKAGSAPTQPAAPALVAKPTASAVLVDGKKVDFEAYNIEGSNYFKLRDLAFALNGTAKGFEVSYDDSAKAISMTSGKAYTPVGGEMEGKGGQNQTPTPTTAKLLLDGKAVSLTAYNIGGNNYFKLRDVGQAFDFNVSWDAASSTITISTKESYTAD